MTDTQADTGTKSGTAAGNTVGGSGVAHHRLGELLVDTKLITVEQLTEAREERKKTGAFLSNILVRSKFITQEDLNACFVKKCKIPHISLLDYDIGADVLALVPREICLEYGLLPIDKLGRILTIAMVDPLDAEALEVVRQACPALRIKPILCNWNHFEQVTAKYFAESESGDGAGAAMSAASLGLSAVPPKQRPAPKATSAPPMEAAGSGASGLTTPAAAVDTGALVAAIQSGFQGMAKELGAQGGTVTVEAPEFPMESFAKTIQTSMRDALGEALSAVAQIPDQTGPAPDWSGLEAAFRASIDELKDVVRTSAVALPDAVPMAVSETVPPAMPSGMEETLKSLVEVLTRQPAPPANEGVAEAIRESVGAAMQEALASVIVQLRASAKAEQPETPNFEAFSEMIRDAIGATMEEVMATMIVQLRANPSSEGNEQVVAALRNSQEGMVASMRDMLAASQESQNAQGARLTAIAEAAVESSQQTTQLIEATLVQNERVQNLQQGQRPAHASVSPFGASGSGDDDAHAEEDAQVRDALESEVPLETLTFDTFFPGETNSFTAKICEGVAAKPGSAYNPLFLYGDVGLGKTHLISAVGNHIQQKNPKHRVGYVSASHFARRLKEAVAADAQMAFRDNYCHWDVLILDDIQFMGGRVEAQEEFFHIFNVLHQRGRQIIIASDKAPDRLGLLEQRLISRFASGIVAELKPPEWETRMKILRQHLGAEGVALPEEICSLVAMRVSNDMRKMVGSLRKMMAFAALTKEAISVEMATEILSHIGGGEAA